MVRDTSAWAIDSSRHQPESLPAVANGSGRRCSQRRKHLDGAGLQRVAHPLQQGRVIAGGEPAGQLGERQAHLARVLPGPLGEVIDGDPAVLLAEGELRALAGAGTALAGDELPPGLLGHPDRRDLRAAGGSSPLQVRVHHLDVAVGGLQRHHRDVIGLSERGDPAAESVPDLLQARRGRDPIAAMIQELDHLPAHLQPAEIPVQVKTVQAFQVQLHVPVQHIVHRDRHRSPDPGCHDNLQDAAYERRMRPPDRETPADTENLGGIRRACLGGH
jgi:hypothetical protein